MIELKTGGKAMRLEPFGVVTAGPDGALWFTGYSGGYVGRISTTGVITEYTAATVIPPGDTMRVDGFGNLVISIDDGGECES